MAIQTLLTWTIAPNGVDSSASARVLRASIVVSTLVAVPPGQSVPIASHPWFSNWPKTLRDAIGASGTLELKVGKRGDLVGRPAKATLVALPASTTYPANRNLWVDLFRDSIAGTIPEKNEKAIAGFGEAKALADQRFRLQMALRGGASLSATALSPTAFDGSDGEQILLDRLSELGGRHRADTILALDGTRARVDFHERVASFLGYRSVARELGLVLDVTFAFDGGALDWIRLEPSGFPTPFQPSSPQGDHTLSHRSPRTLVEVSGTRDAPESFRALPAVTAATHGVPLPPNVLVDGFGSLTDEGLVHLDPKSTQISCWDPLIEAALKNDGKPPASRFGGDQIIVVSPAADRALNTWNARANALRGQAGDIELFADDLVRGLAIDLAEVQDDTSPALWLSLCARRGTHHAREAGAPSITEKGEEAPLELAVLKSTTGAHYAAQSVFRLDGWSLVCPRPDRAHDDAADDTEEVLITDLAPPDNSLPRFRYGRRYLCRARALDIAGNDLTKMTRSPAKADDRAAIKDRSLDFSFNRTSPIAPPIVVAPRRYSSAEGGWPNDPQSPGHVAVGYAFTKKDGTKDDHREETRWILPPAGSVTVTDFEGSLDRVTDDAKAYDVLKRVDHVPPDTLPSSTRIEYLSDPFADGVVIDGSPEMRGEEPFFDGAPGLTGPTRPLKSDWPNRLELHQPIRLQVRPADEAHQPDAQRETKLSVFLDQGKPNAPEIAALAGRDQTAAISDGEAVFFVRRGKRHRIGIRSWTEGVHRATHAMLHLEAASELFASSVEDITSVAATEIRDDLATPATAVEIVHPVDKPLFHPRLYPAGPKAPLVSATNHRWLAPRELDALDVRLVFSVLVHAATTGQVDLLASWTDAVDDGTAKPEELIVSTRDVRTIESGYQKDSGLKIFDMEARQVFKDHKCRVVTYQLRAATAFPEYYTSAEVKAQAYYGHLQAVIVPATRPPSPPTIQRILPSYSHDKDDVRHHHRRVRLRITLARDWFSSGEGELLAVLVQPPAKPTSVLDDRVQDACTVWGNDPIRDFEAAGDARASVRVTTPGETIAFKIERGRERGLAVDVHAIETKVEATHEIDGKLVYERFVDVAIDVGEPADVAYEPFVRMALARYQPNAVENAKLSDVVFATFIQLPPDRSVTIVEQGTNLEVQVRGPGPRTNEMWVAFVAENERRFAVDAKNNVELVTANVPLLIGARDPGNWIAGQADGQWNKVLGKPSGKNRLVIVEREKIGGEWVERTVCNILYEG